MTNGYLDNVPLDKVEDYERKLYEKLEKEKPNLLIRFEEGYFDESDEQELKDVLEGMSI